MCRATFTAPRLFADLSGRLPLFLFLLLLRPARS
jgi:hypothetical protein